MSKHYRTENNCLNCGNDVNGKFCSNCGQENIEIKEPFWTFVGHGVGHYFHYDSKFKNTLKPFLTKPGKLTNDHIGGRRARHIPPISLYLFITLIYFLFAPTFKDKKDNNTTFNYEYNQKTGELEKTMSHSEREAEEDSIYSVFKTYSYNRQLTELAKLDSQLSKEDEGAKKIRTDFFERLKRLKVSAADSTIESYRSRQDNLPISQRDNWFDHFWNERQITYKEKTGRDIDIKDMLNKNFPKLLFVLMPVFAFFLMLNFRKNKKLYIEHLIYTIHLFSFAFLSFFVSEFLIYLTPLNVGAVISILTFGILIWYTYRSIRVVYERSRWVSVRKLFSISMLFCLALVITYILGSFTIIVFTG